MKVTTSQAIVMTSGAETTGILDFQSFSGGGFIVPADVTAITIYASSNGSLFGILCDYEGAAIGAQAVAAGTFFAIPPSAYGAEFLKFVLVGEDSATVQVSCKS